MIAYSGDGTTTVTFKESTGSASTLLLLSAGGWPLPPEPPEPNPFIEFDPHGWMTWLHTLRARVTVGRRVPLGRSGGRLARSEVSGPRWGSRMAW